METRQKLQKAILRGVVGQASSLPLRASCPRNFVLGLEARGGRQDVCPTTLAVASDGPGASAAPLDSVTGRTGGAFGHDQANSSLRACLKTRPVRGPGVQDWLALVVSCRPRALTRQGGGILKQALRFGIGGKLFRDRLIDPRRSFANGTDRVCV